MEWWNELFTQGVDGVNPILKRTGNSRKWTFNVTNDTNVTNAANVTNVTGS